MIIKILQQKLRNLKLKNKYQINYFNIFFIDSFLIDKKNLEREKAKVIYIGNHFIAIAFTMLLSLLSRKSKF